MILYALNACGKSSLLRSVGLSVIMAQCGMYVPCSRFVYSPFSTIVSQVELSDNLWKGQSSFKYEMIGLRKILKIADSKTLVLSDELTKGTEAVSATSIFASAALELSKRNCKFIFTTHLTDVAKLQEIQNDRGIMICHLNVEFNDSEIVFGRKLKPGPCDELYGLEVAKAIGLESTFIENAFAIRNKMVNRSEKLVSTRRSRYNSKKILDSCEICEWKPLKNTDIPLDCHHIKFQCTANDQNFTGHYHKDSLYNLVTLCKMCHIKVHSGDIDINGYQQTTNGVKLDYSINQNVKVVSSITQNN